MSLYVRRMAPLEKQPRLLLIIAENSEHANLKANFVVSLQRPQGVYSNRYNLERTSERPYSLHLSQDAAVRQSITQNYMVELSHVHCMTCKCSHWL